jgi:hypothetical protein
MLKLILGVKMGKPGLPAKKPRFKLIATPQQNPRASHVVIGRWREWRAYRSSAMRFLTAKPYTLSPAAQLALKIIHPTGVIGRTQISAQNHRSPPPNG